MKGRREAYREAGEVGKGGEVGVVGLQHASKVQGQGGESGQHGQDMHTGLHAGRPLQLQPLQPTPCLPHHKPSEHRQHTAQHAERLLQLQPTPRLRPKYLTPAAAKALQSTAKVRQNMLGGPQSSSPLLACIQPHIMRLVSTTKVPHMLLGELQPTPCLQPLLSHQPLKYGPSTVKHAGRRLQL